MASNKGCGSKILGVILAVVVLLIVTGIGGLIDDKFLRIPIAPGMGTGLVGILFGIGGIILAIYTYKAVNK